MEGYWSIWTQGLSTMHHGVPGVGEAQTCVAVTSSTGDANGTQTLHWMHYLIEYLQWTLQWELSSPSHSWREWNSESWNNCIGQSMLRSRYCVWTERPSLELLLSNWRKDANANFPKLDPLGVLQSWWFFISSMDSLRWSSFLKDFHKSLFLSQDSQDGPRK